MDGSKFVVPQVWAQVLLRMPGCEDNAHLLLPALHSFIFPTPLSPLSTEQCRGMGNRGCAQVPVPQTYAAFRFFFNLSYAC